MKQICQNCGEELLGEVNRCWKCGQEVAPVLVAEALPEAAAPAPVARASGPEPALRAGEPVAVRRPIVTPPARDTLASGAAAVLALVFACGALYVACSSHWGMALAGLAIVLAAWGTFSRLRGLALLALVLATLAVGVAAFNLAVDVYRARTGVHPFAPNTPVE